VAASGAARHAHRSPFPVRLLQGDRLTKLRKSPVSARIVLRPGPAPYRPGHQPVCRPSASTKVENQHWPHSCNGLLPLHTTCAGLNVAYSSSLSAAPWPGHVLHGTPATSTAPTPRKLNSCAVAPPLAAEYGLETPGQEGHPTLTGPNGALPTLTWLTRRLPGLSRPCSRPQRRAPTPSATRSCAGS
jgi:hypothetical protein